MIKIKLVFLFWLAAGTLLAKESVDVVIYGGSAGGVMAALAAAEEGARVILVSPGRHLGGMLTGGLGRTDMDRQQHLIGGSALEFFRRTGRHYGQELAWFFEPKVAEKILGDWLAEKRVTVRLDCVLKEVRMHENMGRAPELGSGTALFSGQRAGSPGESAPGSFSMGTSER